MKLLHKIAALLLVFIINISYAGKPANDSIYLPKFEMTTEDCDACGCSVNNNSIGSDGLLTQRYIGIKYVSQHYKVKENIFLKDPTQSEFYNSIQLIGKLPLTDKMVVYALVPYHYNIKEKNPREEISGIGDLTVLANYYLLNDRWNSKNSPHRLLISGGIKFPTGKFDMKNTTAVNPSFQLGTGSWDFLTSVNYQFIKDNFAVQLGSDYIFKNMNKKHYQFGDQWNSSVTGYYFISINRVTLTPKMGILSEIYQSNKQLGDYIPKTSGELILGKSGIEISYKNFTLGTDISLPVYSHLSDNEIKMVSRFSTFFNWNF